MRRYTLDPVGVFLLSLRQLYRRLPVWIQINFLGLLFSLPVVTFPAAQAGLYYAIREGLLERLDGRNTPRTVFFQGFRRYFIRSMVTLAIDLVVGAIIIYSFFFWASSETPFLNYVAAISLYFGIFWLVCQPFLFPVFVEYPELPPVAVLKQTMLLVVSRPLYTLLTAMLVAILNFFGLVLLGPVLLVLGALVALITIQALWLMQDQELPDLREDNDKRAERL
jgi:uncharacterized membrane protein YesL